MLKKNEVLEVLANGGHVTLSEIYNTARVISATGESLGTCRFDTATRIGSGEGFEIVRIGSAWNYTKHVRMIGREETAKAAAAAELSEIRTPGEIKIRALSNMYLGKEIKKGATFLITVYGDGTHSQPGNAYGKLYDFNENDHAVFFEIVERPEPAADPEQEPAPVEDLNATSERVHAATCAALEKAGMLAEPDPIYIDETAPTSNSIPGVYYFIEFETGNGQFTVQHYTVDDLTAFVSDVKRHHDHRITRAYRVNTATGERVPFIPETRQERTDRENRAHCQRIAETLEAYAKGTMYRCPECGEEIEIEDRDDLTTENEDGETVYRLPCGCCTEYEPEQLSLYDYFEDVLDIEYRVEADRKTVRSVSLMVAFGGPNIYIDTAENAVMLYWYTDRARYSFDSWIGDEINAWAEELWNC